MSRKWDLETSFFNTNLKLINYAKKIRHDIGNLDLDYPLLNFCYINQDKQIISKIKQNYFNTNPVTIAYENRNENKSDHNLRRQSILRLLCAANKAHFFLFEKENVVGTPSFIEYPNFINSESGDCLFEIIYYLTNQTIIIASDWSSENKTIKAPQNFNQFIRFPVSMSTNSQNWLRKKRWEAYKKQAINQFDKSEYNSKQHNNQCSNQYYNNFKDNTGNLTLNRTTQKISLNEDFESIKNTSCYIVEITDSDTVQYKKKEHICRLCGGLKILFYGNNYTQAFYYWPLGWDYDMVVEYIDYYFDAIYNNKKNIPALVQWN